MQAQNRCIICGGKVYRGLRCMLHHFEKLKADGRYYKIKSKKKQ